MRGSLVLLLSALLVACSSSAPPTPSGTTFWATYSYSLTTPETDLHAGETRLLSWTPRATGWTRDRPAPVHLCFAVIGEFPTIGDLKSSQQPRPSCPVSSPGVAFASDALEVDPLSGTAPRQELRLPATLRPGLYNFVQIVDWGGGNAMSAAGVITVVAAP